MSIRSHSKQDSPQATDTEANLPALTGQAAARHTALRLLPRWTIGLTMGAAVFACYLALARSLGVSADGASDALQAWDMLHGNPLLSGWVLTDVSFYTNELILFMFVEMITGLNDDALYAGVALTLLLVVSVVAATARGTATGSQGRYRALLAALVVAVPAVGLGVSVQLNSPNHTGAAIPLLLAWLVIDRARPGSNWLPWLVAGILAIGQIADPLVMYIGALPLVLVSAGRMVRDRAWWGADMRLVVAAVGSVVLAESAKLAIRALGGWTAYAPPVVFAPAEELVPNLRLATLGVAGNFGALFADRQGLWGTAVGVVHLLMLLTAIATTVLVLWRGLRRAAGDGGDRVAELAAIGIAVNLGAYVVSTLPSDLGTARHIVAVGPLAAVLVGRVWGAKLSQARPGWRLGAGALALLLAAELVSSAALAPRSTHAHDVARWLASSGLRHGLGGYWYANNLTLMTGGLVQVAPVVDAGEIRAYRWESRPDWYDPARHDARFLVMDARDVDASFTSRLGVQFGRPTARHDFSTSVVFVYDHNLLIGLPAACVPEMAPSMAECPPIPARLFG